MLSEAGVSALGVAGVRHSDSVAVECEGEAWEAIEPEGEW